MSAYRKAAERDHNPAMAEREPISIPAALEHRLRVAHDAHRVAEGAGCDISATERCSWGEKKCCAKCKHRLATFSEKEAADRQLSRFVGAAIAGRPEPIEVPTEPGKPSQKDRLRAHWRDAILVAVGAFGVVQLAIEVAR